MDRPAALGSYRVLLQGQGCNSRGEWTGFFTARQVRASSDASAREKAIETVLSDVSAEVTELLAEVHQVWPLASRRVRFSWFKAPRGGFTFYNDDHEAMTTAEQIERSASGFS